jgi:cyclopropane-fatty-acyl-phospholipid synthase
MSLQTLLEELVGPEPPVAIEAYDGTRLGPDDADARIVIRSPDALRRILFKPGELGFARAYVTGDLDVEGEIWPVLDLRERIRAPKLPARHLLTAAAEVGLRHLHPLPPPAEEARLRGRRHTRQRDAQAVSHHYDVSNEFYRLVLDESMTYSCAVFEEPNQSLDRAQRNKYELISRKLALGPGQRLLDVGCGWGGMVMHAARHHDVRAVGITLSQRQAELAAKRVTEAGLADRIEIRLCDYRDVDDGPYDAISSIGMFEHVGLERLQEYAAVLFRLLRAGGRLLNHGISRKPGTDPAIHRDGFMGRYIFPDGALHEVGAAVTTLQDAGFEVRHSENLREHYARTLRHWVFNLESNWDAAVAEVGESRARIWRLYLAACAVAFDDGGIQIHQVLAVHPGDDGTSAMPLRPDWDGPLDLASPPGR